MKRYEIAYRPGPPPLEARNQAYWADVAGDVIGIFPWYQKGDKQLTNFRAVWCPEGLYLRFACDDRHIAAEVTVTNGPVSGDSCVEFFVAPNPRQKFNYYNFEVNCVGTILMGTHCDWGEGYRDRSIDLGLKVATTVAGPTKEESPEDNGWALILGIPWAHFERDARHLPPKSGDVWRGNFYRIGGQTDPQCVCWSPIKLAKPAFHAPEFFGQLVFMK
jgi:hypothetical protein